MTRFARKIVPAAAAAVMLTACAPHKIQYYQLSPSSGATLTRSTAASGVVLGVGRISVPLALQDGRIQYREGPNQVGAYEYHRWTDPPGVMVRDSLISALRGTGIYKSVQEANSSSEGDFTIRGKLLELSEIDGPGIDTRVSLQLEMRDVKSGLVVWSQTFNRDANLSKTRSKAESRTVADVVQSLDNNLQQVIAEASQAIRSYTDSHPKP